MVHGAEQMAANAKQIQDDAVDGQKTLRVCDGGESAHLALALTRRLVRRFRAGLLVLSRAVGDGRHEGAVCRGVTAELVLDQAAPGAALAFQQRSEESSSGVSIASRLHEDVDHIAVLVHGAPEILSPGTVKLMRGGRDDPSMARNPSSFSRHTSPHPIRRTPASEASGGAPTEVDVARPGRDSARVRGPRETAARAPRI